ncbi:hypothetical protein K437DRAFT_294090 [Tilletiaria anomala UBC 951]|uniref:Uncharacterized protein n=1 Tax=Tilletiaria anomala (strain ATCC 24038 / CBS 436.72 / UBC 951) TaxID=1037660 RepID=A0A066W0R7_TILAU|nr:uncharacterized protein K437DRAFT_294090 [Tilletiaria anomala UBC 951]KDN47316.1 hypothetical protein K437DRAFT_294090 [Tilletiaria anomala UBC 951]
MGNDLWTLVVVIAAPSMFRKLNAWYSSPQPAAWKARFTPVVPLRPPLRQGSEDSSTQVYPSQYVAFFLACIIVYMHLRSAWTATDLFLATRTIMTAPTSELKSKLASMSYSEMGWKARWGEEGLEKLITRLSSLDGRRAYLINGPEPLIECLFCKSDKQFAQYAIARRSLWFVAQASLVGALTIPGSTLRFFDEFATGFGLSAGNSASPQTLPQARWNSSHWRIPATCGLLGLASIRVGVLLYYATVSSDQNRMNHWHVNLQLFESLAAAALYILIILYPSLGPLPATAHRVIAAQHATMKALDNSIIGHQTMSFNRDLVRRHPELQDRVQQHWATTRDSAVASISAATQANIVHSTDKAGAESERASAESWLAQMRLEDLKTAARCSKVDVNQESKLAMNYAKRMWDGSLMDDTIDSAAEQHKHQP